MEVARSDLRCEGESTSLSTGLRAGADGQSFAIASKLGHGPSQSQAQSGPTSRQVSRSGPNKSEPLVDLKPAPAQSRGFRAFQSGFTGKGLLGRQ